MLAGMSVVMPLGMLVDMLPVMLPDILSGILTVRLFGILAMKSTGKFISVASNQMVNNGCHCHNGTLTLLKHFSDRAILNI